MAHAPNSGIVPSTYALRLPRCNANRKDVARLVGICPSLDKLARTGHDYLASDTALWLGVHMKGYKRTTSAVVVRVLFCLCS